MSKQLLRCGTSIGANVREGQYAQSKKDFISKMNRRPSERRAKLAWAFPSEKEEDEVNIALKEAGETDYWLDVIHSADYFSEEEYASLDADNKEPTTSRA